MTWSIRARLTAWYLGLVVLTLVSGVLVATTVFHQRALDRFDEDMARTMATLQGVMRTEFGEGLDLEASAKEASVEVVAPGRALAIGTSSGATIAAWGTPLLPDSLGALPLLGTIDTAQGRIRVLRHDVRHQDQLYIAVVGARLEDLEAQYAGMATALWVGVGLALVVAGLGGWVIGRQALIPLSDMARQASLIDARRPRERLSVPRPDDEVGTLATAFNHVLDRLATSLEQQRQFMADASHELRTPVSVVRTTAQVTLEHDTRSSDEYRESLTIVGEQSHRLARIVDAMFLLSRAEADGVPLQPAFLHLDELTDDSVRALRVLASRRAVSVARTGEDEVALVGDDGLLRRAIGNLLDNAIRHALTGSTVVADVRMEGPMAVLRVSNVGEPIPAPDRDRIFDRFVRHTTSEGAGLGLPIARWIAQAHGGTVALAASDATGTTFVVTLPTRHLEQVSPA